MDINSTFQLFICLGALVWIVWLFLSYGTKHAGNVEAKVHTLYLSGIGTLIILELIVYICLQSSIDKRTIMDTVAFGATLSSLIMSVLAIIFTITSSRGNDVTVGKIEGAIKQLESTANGLTRFSRIADVLNKKTDKLLERIDDLHDFEKYQWSSISKNINADFNSIRPSDSDSGYPKDQMNEVYGEYLSRISFFGALGILACVYSFDNRTKTEKSSRFNMKKAFEFLRIDPPMNFIDYIYGFMVATSSLDLISISLEPNDEVEVYYVYDNIESMLMKRVQAQIINEKDEVEDPNEEILAFIAFNAIRKYFRLEEMNEEKILDYQ